MIESLPVVYLARHVKTAWSLSGQHTGPTDLPLTERASATHRHAERSKALSFSKVFTSPLQRAVRACELAGYGPRAEVDRDLLEWNYGEYEGLRTQELKPLAQDKGFSREVSKGNSRDESNKIYAESFNNPTHLDAILREAQEIVNKTVEVRS